MPCWICIQSGWSRKEKELLSNTKGVAYKLGHSLPALSNLAQSPEALWS